MIGRIFAVAAGFIAGYVVGTRRGREGYERLKKQAVGAWRSPAVQRGVDAAHDFATDRIPVVGGVVASAIDRVSIDVEDAAQESEITAPKTED